MISHKMTKYLLLFRPDQSRPHHGAYGHPRSQRHRKMRDYDSDTGYRSDQELMKFRRQQEQMFQRNDNNYREIVPVASSKGRRRDGYSSDVEGYSRRTMGYHDPSAHDNRSVSSQEGYQSHRSYGNSRSPSKQSVAVRNDELYEQNPMNHSVSHYPSSPAPLLAKNVTDQSTPLLQNKARNSEQEWRQEVFQVSNQMGDMSVVDRENKYMVCTCV